VSKKKWLALVVGVIILIAVISNGSKDESNSGSTEAVAATSEQPLERQVGGKFHRDCFLCDGPLKARIDTSDAWCAWQGDDVIVHVTMTNNSVEHVTVDWHPSFTISGGGEHGAGLTSTQSDGFDPGETRELAAHQNPEGVAPGSPIGTCKPSFSMIESG
jgi:hypothetical protein